MTILICQQRRPSPLLHQCPGHMLSVTKNHLQGKLSVFDGELSPPLKLQQHSSPLNRDTHSSGLGNPHFTNQVNVAGLSLIVNIYAVCCNEV